MTTTRYGASRAQYETWIAAHGQPKYRVQQAWDALYRERRPLETVTNLPVAVRDELVEAFPLELATIVEQRGDHEQTRKSL